MGVAIAFTALLLLWKLPRPPRPVSPNQPKPAGTDFISRDALARLIAKLHAIKPDLDNFDEPCAVASLEDFFEGHEDRYSIASNLIEHPGSQAFYRLLSRIRSRSDVQDVLVQITQWEAEDEWPYSDTIFIITSAPLEEVREWVASLQPDEVLEGWTADEPPLGAPSIQPGTRPVTVWWD